MPIIRPPKLWDKYTNKSVLKNDFSTAKVISVNKKQKGEFLDVFVEAFHEVVVPVLTDLASKNDVKRVEKKVDYLDDKVEMINKRLINTTGRHSERIDNHEKRITRAEKRLKISPAA